jgi:hypothetical protein
MMHATMLALTYTAVAALGSPVAVDKAMHPTYDRLAARVLRRFDAQPDDKPLWVCIAGGPGSGKSTLAEAVCERINALKSMEYAVVLPMDGFHYSRAELCALDPPDAPTYLPRRGAPWTFDAEKCFECFRAAKCDGEAVLPTYSRELSDPVPGGVQLAQSHRIVLVEGNYLLGATGDNRWEPLNELWDERARRPAHGLIYRPTCSPCGHCSRLLIAMHVLHLCLPGWFIRCVSAAEQRKRLIARHLETWNDEKAKRWGPGEEGAAARADANDVLNMELIAPCENRAELTIESI